MGGVANLLVLLLRDMGVNPADAYKKWQNITSVQSFLPCRIQPQKLNVQQRKLTHIQRVNVSLPADHLNQASIMADRHSFPARVTTFISSLVLHLPVSSLVLPL